MKVLLIGLETSPSLSLPILQECLIEKNIKCDYLHLPTNKELTESQLNNIISQIKELTTGVELIGISLMTNTFYIFKKLSEKIKEWNIPIVSGGIHATVEPEECLKYSDYVCVAEGEMALVELAKRISAKKRTDNIASIYCKKGNEIIRNKLSGCVPDLNAIPVPKVNLRNKLFLYNGKIRRISEDKKILKEYYKNYYYILTSRGCPYRCKYCLNDSLINIDPNFAKIRRRNSNHIIKELKSVKKILPKGIVIGFVDDDFCAKSTQELKDFCHLYKKEIGLPFFCASTPTSINNKKVLALISAGMIRLEIGIQSISDTVNNEIFGRLASRKQSITVTNLLEKYRNNIQLCYDFILDNPWEKEYTKIETLRFIMNLRRPVTISLFSLTLYPGTSLFKRATEEGLIQDVYKDVYNKNHMILENDPIGTLFVLYTKYLFPKAIIEALLISMKIPFVKIILTKSTFFLWRLYNYYLGLIQSIQRKDKIRRNYYLTAPLKKIFKPIRAL